VFCRNCGQELPEGTRFCPNCGAENGATTEDIKTAAENVFNNTEKQMESAINDVKQTFSGAPYAGEKLQEDRGLLAYIVLSIVTCGIYGYYFIYKMAKDVNTACDGDGETTGGLVAFILLSMVTCGIYSFYWQYKLGNRLANNAQRYGLTFQENGTTIIMWDIFGAVLCGIGPFIAMNILIKNTNKICAAYNRSHNL